MDRIPSTDANCRHGIEFEGQKSKINELVRIDFQLRRLWLRVLCFGVLLAAPGFIFCITPLSSIGMAIIGLAVGVLLSSPEHLLLRGSRDAVYLVENRFWKPRVCHLADRETMNAFSGEWHKVLHVSEKRMNSIGKKADKLKLKEADLYQPEGQKTVHAVLKGVRYGIPDPQTLQRIWGLDPEIRNEEVNCFLPGRDLVSVWCWPPKDQ